jgi:hypothetical protein
MAFFKKITANLFIVSVASTIGLPVATANVVRLTDDATLLQQHNSGNYFAQNGISNEQSNVVETAGVDNPLEIALGFIVPKSWKINYSGDYKNKTVSWQGGLSWPLILKNIADKEKIYITLDWIQKIANVHVDGISDQTTLSSVDVIEKQKKNSDLIAHFKKKEKAKWEKRENTVEKIIHDETLTTVLEQNREARKSQMDYLEKLQEENIKIENSKKLLEEQLVKEKKTNEKLAEKYAVFDGNNSADKNNKDATELYQEYKNAWVLPLNDDFDYFIKGGYTDSIKYETPATYIAKSGSIEDVVRNWGESVGWFLEYSASVQHYNPYEVKFKGNFHDVCVDLIKIFKGSDRPLNISFYPDIVVNKNGKTYKGLVRITDLNFTTIKEIK